MELQTGQDRVALRIEDITGDGHVAIGSLVLEGRKHVKRRVFGLIPITSARRDVAGCVVVDVLVE